MKFLVVILAVLGVTTGSPFGQRAFNFFPERIVGGVEAGKGDFPFMVEIRRGSHYCGGSIVNDQYIVTAAHCSEATITGYTVVAGEHRLNVDEGTEQVRTVSNILRHPAYSGSSTLANDIAVWRLESPFIFNQYVQPANLAPTGFVPAADVDVAGWGALSSGGGSPTVLMRVEVPMFDFEQCKVNYQNAPVPMPDVIPGMFCAGVGGKDSCQGDSGGPVVSGNTLYGIVSWGYRCAEPGYPGVYADVSYYYNWIQQNTL